MPIVVDANITIPRRRGGPGSIALYPWRTMAVGHSFLMPLHRKDGALGTIGRSLLPKRFITRKVDVDGVPRIRVWRVE